MQSLLLGHILLCMTLVHQRGLTYRPEGVSGLLLLLSFLLLLYLLLAEQRIIKTLVGRDSGNGFVQAPFQRIIITALVLSNWPVKTWTNGGTKHGKVYRKTCWSQRMSPGNCVLLRVSFRLQNQVVGFKGSQGPDSLDLLPFLHVLPLLLLWLSSHILTDGFGH